MNDRAITPADDLPLDARYVGTDLKAKPLTLRRALATVLHTDDIDAPVYVRLGLWDDRVVRVTSWSVSNGHLTLTLEDQEEFPVATPIDHRNRIRAARRG